MSSFRVPNRWPVSGVGSVAVEARAVHVSALTRRLSRTHAPQSLLRRSSPLRAPAPPISAGQARRARTTTSWRCEARLSAPDLTPNSTGLGASDRRGSIAPRRGDWRGAKVRAPKLLSQLETTAVSPPFSLIQLVDMDGVGVADGAHGELTRQRHHLFRRSTQKGGPKSRPLAFSRSITPRRYPVVPRKSPARVFGLDRGAGLARLGCGAN